MGLDRTALPRGAVLDCSAFKPEKQLMDTTVGPLASIGVDIGKEVFNLVGFGTDGKIAFRPQDQATGVIETFKRLAPCVRR